MSKANYHYFNGTALYYRNKSADNYGNYSLKIKLDDVNQYKESGIQCDLDDEGCVWFRRPHSKLIREELVTFGPPKTLGTEKGEDGKYLPLGELVGEGSKIIAKVKSYETGNNRIGHQLEAVQVTELVPVELDNTGSDWYDF